MSVPHAASPSVGNAMGEEALLFFEFLRGCMNYLETKLRVEALVCISLQQKEVFFNRDVQR